MSERAEIAAQLRAMAAEGPVATGPGFTDPLLAAAELLSEPTLDLTPGEMEAIVLAVEAHHYGIGPLREEETGVAKLRKAMQ